MRGRRDTFKTSRCPRKLATRAHGRCGLLRDRRGTFGTSGSIGRRDTFGTSIDVHQHDPIGIINGTGAMLTKLIVPKLVCMHRRDSDPGVKTPGGTGTGVIYDAGVNQCSDVFILANIEQKIRPPT